VHRRERPDVVANAVIETEHGVWMLVAQSARLDLTDGDHMAAVADACAWYAGARQHYCGVIEPSPTHRSLGSMLQADIHGHATALGSSPQPEVLRPRHASNGVRFGGPS
jgi:hypothetical protein